TTAQVHPGRFTEARMRAAQARGAELRLGCVRGLVRAGSGASVKGIEVDGEIVEGDVVVIAMGPWSILAAGWLPLPGVFGLKGHSLVFETGTKIPADALFLEYQETAGITYSPEVFPRGDGTTYVCAISSESPLPEHPPDVAPGGLPPLEPRRQEQNKRGYVLATTPRRCRATARSHSTGWSRIRRNDADILWTIQLAIGARRATGTGCARVA